MTTRQLKSLIRENQRLDAGLETPARVTEIVRDANGNRVRVERAPVTWQRQQAALHAERTRLARHQLKLSQAEFSALMGVSRRTLENWEQGRRIPSGSARVLLTIAERHPRIVLESLA